MGVHSSNLEYLDKIFKTCCALHNLFLDVDGLDKKWDKGKKGYYYDKDQNGNILAIIACVGNANAMELEEENDVDDAQKVLDSTQVGKKLFFNFF